MHTQINTEENTKVKWVSTEWLHQNVSTKDIMILDTQPNIYDYIYEHIPGAQYFNQDLLRMPLNGRPGSYIPKQAMQLLFQRCGLQKNKPIVVYTGKGKIKRWGDGLEQTMVAYSLSRFGHEQVLILDGGLDKWNDENRPVSKEYPVIDESEFTVDIQSDYYATMNDVKNLKDNEDVSLLDARPEKLFNGLGPWNRSGHIPGAINLPWGDLMDPHNTRLLKPDDEIQSILNKKQISKENMIICYCGTGREATNEFLLFKWYLRYPSVKIYEGSFLEWVSYPENKTLTKESSIGEPKEVVE